VKSGASMKKRTQVNLALMVVITSIAFFAAFRPAFAGSRTFLTSCGQMAGYTTPGGGQYKAKSMSQAGAQYWIHVYMNGWGACSPDMGCSWKIKDYKYANNYFSTSTSEVAFADSWIAVSRHRFQLVLGGTIADGYTSGDNNNVYGTYKCWSAFSSTCNK
jgi:hypothetical protein